MIASALLWCVAAVVSKVGGSIIGPWPAVFSDSPRSRLSFSHAFSSVVEPIRAAEIDSRRSNSGRDDRFETHTANADADETKTKCHCNF